MPWKETCAVDNRHEAVRLATRDGLPKAEIARTFGVARKTIHKWTKRFEREGIQGLRDRSRAPRSSPNRTSEEIRELIVAERKRRPTRGARKIVESLVRSGKGRRRDLRARSTVTEILRGADLLGARRTREARTRSAGGVSAHARCCNDLWTADFKGDFLLRDGTRCHPLTVQDHRSRYLLCV